VNIASVRVLIYSEQVRLRKPDPAIFRLTADRLGVAPKRCVFVDEIAHNLEPARQLGMTVVHHVESEATARKLQRLFGVNMGAEEAAEQARAIAARGAVTAADVVDAVDAARDSRA